MFATFKNVSYNDLHRAGVQIRNSKFNELQCIRDELSRNQTVVALTFDHDLCKSRNFFSSSEVNRNECYKLQSIFSTGSSLFSSGVDFFLKANAEQLLNKAVITKIHDTIFIHFRIDDSLASNSTVVFSGITKLLDVFSGSVWAWKINSECGIKYLAELLDLIIKKANNLASYVGVLSNSKILKQFISSYFYLR